MKFYGFYLEKALKTVVVVVNDVISPLFAISSIAMLSWTDAVVI